MNIVINFLKEELKLNNDVLKELNIENKKENYRKIYKQQIRDGIKRTKRWNKDLKKAIKILKGVK